MTSEERYNVCKNCPFFYNVLKTCKKCGCFMPAKTKLNFAKCPMRKW